jgi:hypothetical protein
MMSVQTGASRAIDECKFQFRTRRWNCSTLDETAGAATSGRQLPTIVPLAGMPPPPQASPSTNNKRKTAKGIDTKPLTLDTVADPTILRLLDIYSPINMCAGRYTAQLLAGTIHINILVAYIRHTA